jgi:uncharacterized Rossmann fold enzyme
MTYADTSTINLAIILIAAGIYLVGFFLMLIDKKKYEKKYEKSSIKLRKIAMATAIISSIVSFILVAYKTYWS